MGGWARAGRHTPLALGVWLLAACGGGGSATSPPAAGEPPPAGRGAVSYLHVFGIDAADGLQPNGPLLRAGDGNLYGTTRIGGPHACRLPDTITCGTLFRVAPDGRVTVLHAFGATATDGYTPTAPLIQGRDGALYGLTSSGGVHGAGTAYRITLQGVYTTLVSFGRSPGDGAVPVGGLVEASDGHFYGATAYGGIHRCPIPRDGGNCGTVFRMSPDGVTSVIHSFGSSPTDGVTPNGSLIQARDGHLYGTTASGGVNDCSVTFEPARICGTVYRVSLAGALSVVHSFGGSLAAGSVPQGGLVEDADGTLYGTTVAGGGGGRCLSLGGCGTVFALGLDGRVTVLHAFARESRADGDGPSPYLLLGRDGQLYGTTGSGGAYGSPLEGTVFRLATRGGLTTLHSFGPLGTNPSNPQGGLVEGADGAIYGVTFYNGRLGASGMRSGAGTVFRLTLP